MDFLSLITALHSCQNILSEKKQWTFLQRQEVLLSPKDKFSRVVANYPVLRGVGQGRVAGKPGQAPGCFLPDMLVVAAEGLVDMDQEGKVLGLLQMGLSAGTLKQLRGQQLRLVVM